MFCNVVIIKPFDQVFTYKVKKGQNLKEGSVVIVPFGKNKSQIGMVTEVFKVLNKDEKINPLYIDIINSYDLLIQIEKEKIPADTKQLNIKILEQKVVKLEMPINIRRVKIESLGLINPFKFMRGDVFIQLI